MRLPKSTHIALAALLAVLTTLPTAHAAIARNQLDAALRGPERKKQKIKDADGKTHEFNIKPVSYRVAGATIQVYGQFSHHLRLQDDDQLWYRIEKKRGQPASFEVVKVKNSKMASVLDDLAKTKSLTDLAKDYPWIQFVGKVFEVGQRLTSRGKGWRGAAELFVEALAKRVDRLRPLRTQPGITVYSDSMMKGKAKSFGMTGVKKLSSHKLNDKVSSLTAFVPRGYVLELYKDSNYRGKKMVLEWGAHVIRSLNIHGRNDDFSSLRFRRK